VEWSPVPSADLGLSSRYVSKSYLDNTESADLETPAYFALDASGSYAFDRWASAGRPRLRVQVNNILDDKDIRLSGYAYQYLQQKAGGGSALLGIPYYYPLATRSVFVTLDFRL
jgi:iron complex outermembrane receptor protein